MNPGGGNHESRPYKEKTLKRLVKTINKDIKQVNKVDILTYFNDLTKKHRLKESTAELEKIIIKQFYKYLFDDELPKFWKGIKNNPSAFKSDKHNDILTQEEVFRMIDVCTNSEHKALISILYDTGARINELLSLNIGDVFNDGEQVSLKIRNLEGNKTGEREIKIPLIISAKYLLNWLEDHPLKHSNDSPLFTSRCHRTYNQRLTREGTYGLLQETAKKVGITKHIDNHLFRHSRATDLDKKGYPQSMMCVRFGWTRNSAMLRKYSHQLQIDTTNRFYEVEGFKPPTVNKQDNKLKPVECPRCGTLNNVTAKHCNKCWLPIDETTAHVELQKKKELEERVKLMEEFMTSTFGKILLNMPVSEKKVYETPVEDLIKNPMTPAYVETTIGGNKQTLDEMLNEFKHFKQVTTQQLDRHKGAILTDEERIKLEKYKTWIEQLLT
jgi:site-specific recombinase XerD